MSNSVVPALYTANLLIAAELLEPFMWLVLLILWDRGLSLYLLDSSCVFGPVGTVGF